MYSYNSSNNNSNSDKDVSEQSLIGSRVALMRKSVTHFGTILSSCTVEGMTHYKIVYDDKFQEEADLLELSRHQELYYIEVENDVVGQQKQKVRSTHNDEYVGTRVVFWYTGLTFYGIVKRCFLVVNELRLGIFCMTIKTQQMYFLHH